VVGALLYRSSPAGVCIISLTDSAGVCMSLTDSAGVCIISLTGSAGVCMSLTDSAGVCIISLTDSAGVCMSLTDSAGVCIISLTDGWWELCSTDLHLRESPIDLECRELYFDRLSPAMKWKRKRN
jgi:acyl-coenzyme A thioesterase PaaI-like protein